MSSLLTILYVFVRGKLPGILCRRCLYNLLYPSPLAVHLNIVSSLQVTAQQQLPSTSTLIALILTPWLSPDRCDSAMKDVVQHNRDNITITNVI